MIGLRLAAILAALFAAGCSFSASLRAAPSGPSDEVIAALQKLAKTDQVLAQKIAELTPKDKPK